MRKILSALADLNMPIEILQHAYKRAVFMIPLSRNFRDVLLGISKKPDYYFSTNNGIDANKCITDFWVKRWLIKRIKRRNSGPGRFTHSSYPVHPWSKVPDVKLEDNDQLSLFN